MDPFLLFTTALFMGIKSSSANGRVQIGVVRTSVLDSVTTLRYLNGNCSWRTITSILNVPTDIEFSVGPQVELEVSDDEGVTELRCVVNGTSVQLHAFIIPQDTIPAPENVTVNLAIDKRILQWDYILQPSDLPPDFELVHDYSIFYLVHTYKKNDVESVKSVDVLERSLDAELVEIDICDKQELIVQAVINGINFGDNSSAVVVAFSDVPVFTNLSAHVQLLAKEKVHRGYYLQVEFRLKEKQQQLLECDLSFIVDFQSLGIFTLQLNSTNIETGTAELTLPLNVSDPVTDVCSLRGVVFGSNNIGNSTAVDIQLPCDCTSVVPASSSTAVTTIPTAAVTSPTASSLPSPTSSARRHRHDSFKAIIAVVVVVVCVFAAIIAAAFMLFIVVKRHRRYRAPKAEPNEYLTVAIQEDNPAKGEKRKRTTSPTYVEVTPAQQPVEHVRLDDQKIIYATVDHKKTDEVLQTNLKEAALAPKPESSEPKEVSLDPKNVGLSLELHLNPLLVILKPVEAKWYALGEHLKLSETFLDETDTNMEKDEECLSEMLNNWMRYHEPSMEVLNRALSMIDQKPVAFDVTLQDFVFVPEGEEEGGAAPGLPTKHS